MNRCTFAATAEAPADAAHRFLCPRCYGDGPTRSCFSATGERIADPPRLVEPQPSVYSPPAIVLHAPYDPARLRKTTRRMPRIDDLRPRRPVGRPARVEHRLGEVLAVTVNHKGGRPPKNGNTVLPLPDGIESMQSSRTERLAALPWQKIAEKIDAASAFLACPPGRPGV